MIFAELFGALEYVVRQVIRSEHTYKKRLDKRIRPFCGVNVLAFVDWWQLPPVAGTSLCCNPTEVSPGLAFDAMGMLWDTGKDCVQRTWSLERPMRCDDIWYNEFLKQCQFGSLTEENYCLIHGYLTLQSTNVSCTCMDDVVNDPVLGAYKASWMLHLLAKESIH